MSPAEIAILVKARDEASKVLSGIKGKVDNLAGGLKTGLKVAGVAAAGGVGIAAIALTNFVGEAMEAQQVMAQTNAVLTSTQGVAGMTADAVTDLADKLSRQTTFEDDAIQSAENLLLTFTKIGKDVFPEATATVLDMSVALEQDLSTSAVQVGKALNDPIRGVTALSKVGVSFTQQQRDQIRTLVESGDVLKAQRIILDELATEFGGSAAAKAETFGGKMQMLKNQVGELKEGIGMALLPVLTQLADFGLAHVVPWLERGITAASDFTNLIAASLNGNIAEASRLFNELPAPLQKLALWLAENRDEIEQVIRVALQLGQDVLRGLILIVQDLTRYFSEHKEMLIIVGIAIGALLIWLYAIPVAFIAITVGIALLRAHWDEIKAYFEREWPFLLMLATFVFETIKNQITTAIKIISDIIVIVLAVLRGDWSAAWEGIKQLAADVWNGIVTDISLKLGLLRDVIFFAWGLIEGRLTDVWYGLLGLAGGVWNGIRDAILSPVKTVINWIDRLIGKLNDLKDKLNILDDIPGAGAIGGAVGRLFQSGISYVPHTMPAILHAGERVLNAEDNARYSAGSSPAAGGATTVINYIDRVEIHGDPRAGLEALGLPV